jgi:hypothetical protein
MTMAKLSDITPTGALMPLGLFVWLCDRVELPVRACGGQSGDREETHAASTEAILYYD